MPTLVESVVMLSRGDPLPRRRFGFACSTRSSMDSREQKQLLAGLWVGGRGCAGGRLCQQPLAPRVSTCVSMLRPSEGGGVPALFGLVGKSLAFAEFVSSMRRSWPTTGCSMDAAVTGKRDLRSPPQREGALGASAHSGWSALHHIAPRRGRWRETAPALWPQTGESEPMPGKGAWALEAERTEGVGQEAAVLEGAPTPVQLIASSAPLPLVRAGAGGRAREVEHAA